MGFQRGWMGGWVGFDAEEPRLARDPTTAPTAQNHDEQNPYLGASHYHYHPHHHALSPPKSLMTSLAASLGLGRSTSHHGPSKATAGEAAPSSVHAATGLPLPKKEVSIVGV